jgi:hypothetical protein
MDFPSGHWSMTGNVTKPAKSKTRHWFLRGPSGLGHHATHVSAAEQHHASLPMNTPR